MDRRITKGRMKGGDKDKILSRVSTAGNLADVADCDLIVELDAICKPATSIASNTSSLSITKLAAVVKPERAFIGTHFNSPASIMKLVEVIPALQTSPEDVDKICLHGLGHPMGIFKLIDQTGHDLNMNVDQILFEAYGDRFRHSSQIQRLRDAGRLGKKSGQGFYQYNL